MDLLAEVSPDIEVDKALKDWEAQGTVPDLVIIDGADAWVREASDPEKVIRFLKSLIKVAHLWNVALIAVVSPKQKSKEKYLFTRDKIYGTIFWGRISSTLLHISLMDEEDPDSTREIQVLPRTGRSEKFYFDFEDGLLVYKEEESMKRAKQAEEGRQKQTEKTKWEMLARLMTMEEGARVTVNDFPWIAESTAERRLRDLARPEEGWVEKRPIGEKLSGWFCSARKQEF